MDREACRLESMVGYSLWGRKESDTTERLHFHLASSALVEYWSELPFLTPGELPNPGIKPTSLTSPALAGRFFTTSAPGKQNGYYRILNRVPCDIQ